MRKFAVTLTFVTGLAGGANADPHNVFGTWATQAGTSHIEITDCGDGSPCGTVVWIDAEALQPGVTPETAVDAKGDNVLGLKLLHSFKRKKKDWRSGTIYDPEAGKTYSSQIKLREDGKLQVKGCVGPFCQTQVWERAIGAKVKSRPD